MDSLTSVCRVCLQNNPETNSLFDEVEYNDEVKLSNIFKKVTGIEVLETDEEKPLRLCHTCTERLLSAYDFICAVEESELEIENFLTLEKHSTEQLVPKIENEEEIQEETILVEVEHEETDMEEIEVLDEVYQTDQQQQEQIEEENKDVEEVKLFEEHELNKDVEIVIEEEIPSDAVFIITDDQIYGETIGSRLSKTSTRNFKCDKCERLFARCETLERHIKTAHTYVQMEHLEQNSPQDSATTNSQAKKRITCDHCPQSFMRRNNYVRHLLNSHSYDENQLSPEDKELVQTKHTYKRSKCPYCGETFTQASLIVHIRRHTGENPYQCDQCDKAFPRRQDLLVHQRVHTGEKPHICTVCAKLFSRANKLTRHMRIHTGERPYKCTQCERSFAQSNDLKIHMRRHTGEKPYKCNVCGEAFICGAALTTHRRQKNHNSPGDEEKDPFATWRVCKRKWITDKTIDEDAERDKVETLFI